MTTSHPRTLQAAVLAATALATALALTGCTPTPATPGSPTASTPAATTASPEDPMAPLPQDPTRDQLLNQMETTLEDFITHQGGTWTVNERVVPGDGPVGQPRPLDYVAAGCRTGAADDEPHHFTLTLRGTGTQNPEKALTDARAWATDHGYTELNNGIDSSPGGLFIALGGKGLPEIVLNASPERALLQAKTPCSAHPSIAAHIHDREADPRYDGRLEHNRFKDYAATHSVEIPDPSPTKTTTP